MTLLEIHQAVGILEVVLVHQFIKSLIEVSPQLSLLNLFPDLRDCICNKRSLELVTNSGIKVWNETIESFFNTIPLQSFDHDSKIIETNLIFFEEIFLMFFSLDLTAKEEKEEESHGQIDTDHIVEEMITLSTN